MRNKAATKCLLALGCLILGTQAQAQTLTERVQILESKMDEAFGLSMVMDFGQTAVQGNGTDYRFTDPDVISTEFLVTL